MEDQNAAVPELERGHGIDTVSLCTQGRVNPPRAPSSQQGSWCNAAVSAESGGSLSVPLENMTISLISFGILENMLLKFLFLWSITFLRLESASHCGTEVFPNLWKNYLS